MDPQLIPELIPLCLLALFAGFVDSMAGGGGMIQLPALFLFQPTLSLAQTLATNKMASFLGTTVSALHFARKIPIQGKRMAWMGLLALIGGMGGAYSIQYFQKQQFIPLILVLLVLVYLLLQRNRELGLTALPPPVWISRLALIWGAMLSLGLGYYEGLIGPGTGSLLVMGLIGLGGMDFLRATAHAKILNGLASLGALLLFLSFDQIHWAIALPMSLCNMAGNYIGSSLAMKKGSKLIRILFQLVLVALILRLGYSLLQGEI